MSITKRRVLLVVLVLLLTLSLIGCSSSNDADTGNGGSQEATAPQQEAKGGTMFLKIGTGFPGGLWYPSSAKLVEILQSEVPNISASVSSTPGHFNLQAVDEGTEMQLTVSTTMTQWEGWNGIAPNYEKPLKNIRLIGTQELMLWQVAVPKDSDIYSIKDLADKRINGGKVGSSDRPIIEAILGAYGITFDSIKANGGEVQALGWEDASSLMQDGHLDCIQTYGAIMPSLINLSTLPGLRFLPLEGPEIDALLEKEGWKGVWRPAVLKAGTYDGQDEDIPTIGLTTTFVCNANLPDDLVYTITKLIYESGYQKDTFASSEAKGWPTVCNIEDIVGAANIPLHPGAQKYFEERGIVFD